MHKHQALDDWSRMGKKYLVVFLTVFLTVLMIPANLRAQAPDTEEDIIKKAAVHFENEDYPAAMPLYSQLLANHPKDPNYNYRFGVCMLYANADKGKALPFLEVASKDPKAEVEVWFYLGRAYHLNYRFDEAIRAYSKYKTLAGEKKAKKLQVDNQIAMCKTGKKLLKAVTDITVLEKKELPVGDFFRSYNLEGYSGQLLVKGDEFKTNLDRKKKETSIIFLSGEKNILYFSSYGDNEENGKDIYRVVRLPTGGWSKPYNVGYPINTEFDEDYPFLHPNGKVLYFSSKGHNSMGGYDIFRSELNEETGSWLKPENMDFAINSPDDDILFVTDMEEKTAWFASARNSPQGMMTVYHVVIERKPVNACLISGKFKPSGIDPSASSKITVRNEETNQPVGVYKSNDQTGAYLISLPNTGGKYTFTVEKSGIHTQTKTVFIPPQYEMKPVRQEIFYTESNGDQLLNVVTYFDEDSASFAPDFLKDKANLDVGDNSGQYEVVDLGNPNQRDPDDKSDPEEDDDSIDVVDQGDPASNVPSSQNKVTTEELITAAFENADETAKEATQLDQQKDRSYAYAQKLNDEAKAKQAEADKAKADAAALPEGPEKVAAQQKAANIQAEANALQSQTVAAFNVAEALEQDAKQKEEEAKLATDYANSLQAASKSSDPKAMDAVAQKELALQNQSDARPQGEELLKNIQESADKKRDQLQTAKSQAQDLRDEQKSNEELIANLKADAAKEKDPDLKAGYESQIEGIEETMADNAAEIKKADAKVASLQNDVNDLDNQVAAATNAINESRNPAVAPVPMKAEDKKALSENVVVYQQRVGDDGSGVAPVTQMPVVQTPVTQNPTNQTPVTQDPVTQNPTTQTPVTQDPVTQNPTTQTPVTQDPVTQNPVNETAITPAADAITDVRNNVSEKIQEAEDISDPVRKEEIIGEAHRAAEQSLDQKIAATQQQLANETDPARKSELQNNIDQLTEEKNQQHQLAEESKQRSLDAIAATDSNEQPADPFAEYTNAIAAADTVSDPAQKENKKAEAYTQWANALDQKIAEDKKTLGATKDKAEKDSLKQVIAADQKKSAELKQDAKTAKAKEQEVIAQQNSPGAKSDRAYADQVATLSQNPNAAEREAAKEAVYTSWADSLDKEADKRDALAAKERNAGKKAELVAQANDLRAGAEEKRALAVKAHDAAEQAVAAQNPVVQNSNTQTPTTQTPGAVVEEGVTYADADAKVALTERDNLNSEAKEFREKQDSLINAASGKSGEEKSELLADASEAQRQAWNKEAEASAAQGEANQEQFTNNAATLQAYETGATGNTNPAIESAKLLNDEAAILLQRAKDKRAEAKLATSQYQRSEALSEAEDLEQQALIKQQEAIARYQQAGVEPAAIAQTPVTQTPVVQNPVTQNPTTQTPDARITNPSTGQAYTPEQIEQIRATPEYENYTSIEKEAVGYDEEVTSLTREGDKYQQSADYNVQQAQEYTLKAADETDPEKKREYVEQSAYFNNEAKKDLAKRDSVNDLADNAKAESRSKHNEADLFLNELDKKVYEDVKTVGDADMNKGVSQPVVQTPTTQNPVTQNPTTQNPVTQNPTTQNPVTQNPTTQNPVTQNPTTQNPVTQNPTTQNPVTQNPTTQNPVTQNPTTQNPVTQNPTTQNPVTQNPTTQNPVTQNPTTQNPVTQNPTTQNPVTQNPTTQNPVTQNPTTQNPDSRITDPATGQAYTPEQVEEIRSSPEYDNYVSVEKEAEGFDEEAVSLKRQADKYQQSADYNVAQAQDFSVKAADETDPEKKRALVEQAKYFNDEARSDMSKRDSVKELVSNAEMEADAKHSEAELYLADLDKKTGDDVKAVATADLNKGAGEPVVQNPVTQTPVNQTPVNQTPVNQNPTTQTPVTQNPVTQTPVNQTPVTQTPVNQTAVNQNPTTQNPVTQNPVTQTPDPGNTSRVASQLQPGEQFRITSQPNVTPIPVDPPVPSGIVYKVQIGAFRNPIPLDLFKGIQPVTAESAGSGITRYTAGLFTEFANADAAKNEIRAMGYPDAFVVAFRDGKRISVADARRNAGSQNPVTQTPVNQTPVNQTPVNQTPVTQTPINQNPNTFEAPATDVKSVQGLFYTVQVGVYSRPVSSERLYNLTGLFSERTANGYIRYASGKYDNANAAVAAKNNIVNIGIKDAFVTAYFDGQRITMDRAAQLEREGVKPEGNNQTPVNQTPVNQTPVNQSPVNPTPNTQNANNAVPVVTNSKPNVPDTGLVFCVQLGAYREVVPVAMANRFLQFASRGVSIYKDANTGLTVYQVGTLNTYAEASQLRAEALSKGITDAFVVAWKDGKKISVEEALKIRPQ